MDATPQEESQGTAAFWSATVDEIKILALLIIWSVSGSYCCGPCPVKAVKDGDVYIPYDTRFVFGEVNGDVVNWVVDKHGEMRVESIKKRRVGTAVMTKSVGSKRGNNITLQYKYIEGSKIA